ncbi:TPA: ankyrin repeat domain-containing protein [Serratia marcescens]
MSRMLMTLTLILASFMVQGCNKSMDYEPQDFFVGEQLEIARLIYENNEAKLKSVLPSISKEALNRPAKAEMTLLFWAVLNSIYDRKSEQRLLIITDLVKAGADPLQPREAGQSSPAEYVLKADSGIWIKALLDGGLSPNAKDKVFDEPVIFESIKAKNTETLQTMLESGANINIRNSLGDTLLIDALDSRSFDHVIFLLENGANSELRGNSGWSMGNQLQRFITMNTGDSEDKLKIEKIKELLVKKGEWPPTPVTAPSTMGK